MLGTAWIGLGLWPAPKPGQSCPVGVTRTYVQTKGFIAMERLRLLQLISVMGRGKGSALRLVAPGVSRRLTEWLYVKDRHVGMFLSGDI